MSGSTTGTVLSWSHIAILAHWHSEQNLRQSKNVSFNRTEFRQAYLGAQATGVHLGILQRRPGGRHRGFTTDSTEPEGGRGSNAQRWRNGNFTSILPSTRQTNITPKRGLFLLRVEGTEGRSDWRAVLKLAFETNLSAFLGQQTYDSKKRWSVRSAIF